jgi:hypothetical protein
MAFPLRAFLTSLTGSSHSVFTLCGWTPALRTIVSGQVLSCGCLAGDYETWTGEVVTVIDAHGPDCPSELHQADVVLARRSTRAVQTASHSLNPLSYSDPPAS